jgi:glycerophosphoryl diester phosphodiesterase
MIRAAESITVLVSSVRRWYHRRRGSPATMDATTPDSSTRPAIPPSLRHLPRDVWQDFRRAFRPLVAFEAIFKTAVVALGAVGTAWIVRPLIASTGHSAVTNTEIARFLVSPPGMAYLVLIVLSLMLGTLLEHVGVIAIAAASLRSDGANVRDVLASLVSVSLRLFSFGVRSLLTLAFVCAPFAVLGGLAYLALLSRHDINYYLANRPPSFYAAVAIGALLLAGLAARLAVLYVDLVLVMPILLFEDRRGRAAVAESRVRVKAARFRIGAIILAWQLAGSMLGVAVVRGFNQGCGLVLESAEVRRIVLVPLVATLLAAQAVLVSGVSFLLVAVHCLLILRFYTERGGRPQPLPIDGAASWIGRVAGGIDPTRWKVLRLRTMVLVLAAIFVGYLAWSVSGRLSARVPIVAVAHRGYARRAPENTLSAFRAAIDVGADFAELDVQETSDGVVVVLHDRDLMRMAGDPRRISDIPFAEARKVDLGRKSDPEFAGERIPTLAEVIALARGRIKLQIELKYYGKDRGLARKVAELIRREDFEDQCEVISLDDDGLRQARQANPRLRVVALVSYALGDPGRLDVDGLSVKTEVLTDRLIRASRRRGKALYTWTVDDPRAMVRLIERGVGGMVTNAPDLLIRIRREREDLSDVERRLLAARYLLGLESAGEAEP